MSHHSTIIHLFLLIFTLSQSDCHIIWSFDSHHVDKGIDDMDIPLQLDSNSDVMDALSSKVLDFGAALPVTELNSAFSEDDPSLTQDQLEIFFERDGDIWNARRSSLTAPWDAPQKVVALSSSAVETTVCIAGDGLTIYFASDRAHLLAKGDLDLYQARRTSRQSAWDEPVPLASLNSASKDAGPFVTENGAYFIFSSTRLADSDGDLFVSSKTIEGWDEPVALQEINTMDGEADPWINNDFTVIVFSKWVSEVSADLWMARRANVADPFGAAAPLSTLNSRSDDEDPWLTQDLNTIFFASSRGGTFDIYMAQRK